MLYVFAVFVVYVWSVITQPDEKAPTYKYKMKYEMAKRLWQAAVEQHAFFRLTFLSLHRNNKYKFCSIILSCGHSSPLCSECSFLTALMLLESQNHSLPKLYIMSQTPPGFSHIFRKRLGIFSPNFTCLLYLLIYA